MTFHRRMIIFVLMVILFSSLTYSARIYPNTLIYSSGNITYNQTFNNNTNYYLNGSMNNETIGNIISLYITAGQGILWNGSQISTTSINGSSTGGNSNETLWAMFANITNIMTNETIMNYVNDNYITYYQNNETILNYIQSNYITYYPSNESIWNNISSMLSGGNGIVYANGIITATSTNDTTIPAQSNETIMHLINGSRYNHTILYEYFANISQIPTYFPNTNSTLWEMFANITNIINNETIMNIINSITTNGTVYYLMSNETIMNIINSITMNDTDDMNNETIYNMINAVSDNDTNTYNTTQEMIDAVNTTNLLLNWTTEIGTIDATDYYVNETGDTLQGDLTLTHDVKLQSNDANTYIKINNKKVIIVLGT